MKAIEARGKTVEEAIETGLAELGLPRDRVDVEVIEAPAKPLFGLIGGKEAVVKIVPRCEDKDRFAMDFIEEVLGAMGVKVTIKASAGEDSIAVDIEGEEAALLIGRRGQTLDALQYLVNVAASRACGEKARIILDVEGYRKRRARSLERLAEQMADRAARTGRRVVLEPMTAHERKIVHVTLQSNSRVTTASEGEEPYRRVVISPEMS
jgi:spoIIIJ-associated protein